ncbi:MAG: metallophosphoesterase family protein [Acidobacteriota bacterium]
MKKTRYTLFFALLFSAALLQLIWGQSKETTATTDPDHITLSWTGNPATTMTVTWRADSTIDHGIVQYRKKNENNPAVRTSEARAHEFTTDLGTSKIFSSTLEGLSPNSEYSYRVGNGSSWSEQNSFTTAPATVSKYKFLVFGDSQSSVTASDPYGEWRQTIHAAFDTEQFSLPQNGPDSLKNQVYSFDYGPVHLIALDSQSLEQKSSGDILALQKPWLEKDLSSSSASWKIAFFHRAPYGVKQGRDEAEIRDAFCPILEKYGVQLVFNAHDHGIKRTYPIKDGQPVDNPLKGTVYYVTGRSGAKTYEDIEPNEHSAFFYAPLDQPNYLIVEGTSEEITVKVVMLDGTVIDTFSIRQP